jgi:dolichyl-phosphate-mannose-protein mannosyltransferase
VASNGAVTGRAPALGSAGHRLGERATAAWGSARGTFGWKPLLVVLALGFVVRVYALLAYVPSSLQWQDAIRYARIGKGPFDDMWQPAGYPGFLWVVRQISNNISFTIGVQHLLGLLSGLLVFAAVRRVAPRPVALVPAAVLILGGDFLFLEATLLAEAYFTFLICCTIYAAIRALDDPHRLRWLVYASLLGGMTAVVRSNALVLPVVVGLWTLIAFAGRLRRRALMVALSVVPAAVLVIAYVIVATSVGQFAGLTDAGNVDLYARVAPFANCSKFHPPAGTVKLCETTPRGLRQGSYWYAWDPTSPGLKYFGQEPSATGPLGKFARAAILGQPLDYAKIVAKDMFRYVDPTAGNDYGFSGTIPDGWTFAYRSVPEEQYIGGLLSQRYDGVLPAHMPGMQELDAYQVTTRLGGLYVAAFAILSILGLVLARGRLRAVIALLALTAFVLYLGPVATISYDARYGIPPLGMLAAAGALGAWAIVLRARRRDPQPVAEQPDLAVREAEPAVIQS